MSAPTLDYTCTHGWCKSAGTYEMPGRCGNCGSEFRVVLTQGHDAPGTWMGARCPNCGCMRVGCYPSHEKGHS